MESLRSIDFNRQNTLILVILIRHFLGGLGNLDILDIFAEGFGINKCPE